jgi:hypothetical protein
MTHTIHKAQVEVWDWKEKLYNELKNVPRNDWAEYLSKQASDTIKYIEDLKKLNSKEN